MAEIEGLERAGAGSVHTRTQRARILRLLVAAHGQWVSLPEILELRISQYGARILELRRLGFNIENKTERIDGVRRSWFRLVPPQEVLAEREARLHTPAPSFELVP